MGTETIRSEHRPIHSVHVDGEKKKSKLDFNIMVTSPTVHAREMLSECHIIIYNIHIGLVRRSVSVCVRGKCSQ